MKSGSLFFFLAFFAILFLISSGTRNAAKIGKVKAGSCPVENAHCLKEEQAKCSNDQQCPQDRKCCHYHCGLKCVKPRGTKSPANQCSCLGGLAHPPTYFIKARQVSKRPVSQEQPQSTCEKDRRWKGPLKCHKGICGRVCMAPEDRFTL